MPRKTLILLLFLGIIYFHQIVGNPSILLEIVQEESSDENCLTFEGASEAEPEKVNIDISNCPMATGVDNKCRKLSWKVIKSHALFEKHPLISTRVSLNTSRLFPCSKCEEEKIVLKSLTNPPKEFHLCRFARSIRDCTTGKEVNASNLTTEADTLFVEIHQCSNSLDPMITLEPYWKVPPQFQTCSTVGGGFSHGELRSPYFGYSYLPRSSLSCTWHVIARKTKQVKLNVQAFEVARGTDGCGSSQVSVYDADKKIGKYCGNDMPQAIVSQSNNLTIVFHSAHDDHKLGFKATYFTGDFSDCQQFRFPLTKIRQFVNFTFSDRNINCLSDHNNSKYFLLPVYQFPHDLRHIGITFKVIGSIIVPPVFIKAVCNRVLPSNIYKVSFMEIPLFGSDNQDLGFALPTTCHISTLIIRFDRHVDLPTNFTLLTNITKLSRADIRECSAGFSTTSTNGGLDDQGQQSIYSFQNPGFRICQFPVSVPSGSIAKFEVTQELPGYYKCNQRGLLIDMQLKEHHVIDLSCYRKSFFRTGGNNFFAWFPSSFTIYMFDYDTVEPVNHEASEKINISISIKSNCKAYWFESSIITDLQNFTTQPANASGDCFIISYIADNVLNNEMFTKHLSNITTTFETSADLYSDIVLIPRLDSPFHLRTEAYYGLVKPYPVVQKTLNGYTLSAQHRLKTDISAGSGGMQYWVVEMGKSQQFKVSVNFSCGVKIPSPTLGVLNPPGKNCSVSFIPNRDTMPRLMLCNIEENSYGYIKFTLKDTSIDAFCSTYNAYFEVVDVILPADQSCRQRFTAVGAETGFEYVTNLCSYAGNSFWYNPVSASIALDTVKVKYGWGYSDPLPPLSFKFVSYKDEFEGQFKLKPRSEVETSDGLLYTLHTSTDTSVVTWRQASLFCKKNGSTLVTMDTPGSLKFIKSFLGSSWLRDIYGSGINTLFLGLNIDANRRFRWQSGQPFTFAEWYHPARKVALPDAVATVVPSSVIQPITHTSHQCVAAFVPNPSMRTHWFTLPCYFPIENVAFICESQVHSTSDNISSSKVTTLSPLAPFQEIATKCPNDSWINYRGLCFMMLTRTESFRTLEFSYTLAGDMCAKAGGIVANVNSIRYNLQELMDSFLHQRYFGCIFINETDSTFCHAVMLKENGTPEIVEVPCEYSPFRIQLSSYWYVVTRCPSVLCTTSAQDYEAVRLPCPAMALDCDGNCLSSMKVCDNLKDCQDGRDEDEERCGNVTFSCSENEHVHISKVCDFVSDCSNNKDEELCAIRNCSVSERKCNNGQCISRSLWCNLTPDCADGSDESLCQEEGTCRYFQCYSGECISKSLVNDSIVDCQGLTGEDDVFDEMETSRFIDYRVVMHGAPGSIVNTDAYCKTARGVRCQRDLPKCIDRSRLCLYDRDLEKTCPAGEHLRHCSQIECPSWFLKCPGSYCVPFRYVCDDMPDCPNGEDEARAQCGFAQTARCEEAYACPDSKVCIPVDEVCNGKKDCPQGKDEELCGALNCPVGCLCSGYAVFCSGFNLTKVPFVFREVRVLTLSNCRIDILENSNFERQYNLRTLDLSRNLIKDIKSQLFVDCLNLQTLDLQHNDIQELGYHTFAGLHSLKNLYITNNPIQKISSIAFIHLQSIKSLDLSMLLIHEIKTKQFTGLQSLDTLLLEGNKIRAIEKDAFETLPSLRYLDIKNNPLITIDPSVFSDMALDKLFMPHPSFCCYASKTRECFPNPDAFSSCTDLMSNEVVKILVWIVGVVAVTGNIFVLVWRLKAEHKQMKAVTMLVINLAVADLFMGIYLLMIASADLCYTGEYFRIENEWRQSRLCQAAGTLAFLSSEMSVCIIALITLDRVLAVKLAMRYSAKSGVKVFSVVVVCCWCVALIISTVPLSQLTYFASFYGRTGVCLPFTLEKVFVPGWEYSTAVVVVFNSLLLLFVPSGYTWIYFRVRISHKNAGRKASVEQIVLARRLAMVVLSDVACWLPIIICSIAALSGAALDRSASVWLAVFVLPMNSALNPILYTLSSIKICRRKKALQKGNRQPVINREGRQGTAENMPSGNSSSNTDHSNKGASEYSNSSNLKDRKKEVIPKEIHGDESEKTDETFV